MGSSKRLFVSLSSIAAFLSVGAISASAFAQDPAAQPATTPPATAAPTATNAPPATGSAATLTPNEQANKDQDEKDNPPMKHVAIELNPLGVLIGHYSVQVELMPWRHSSFIINPHFDYVSSDITSSDGTNSVTYTESFTGFGTELGYRFYTGKTGPTGFYVGPSVLLGTYTASSNAAGASSSIAFTQIGGALDIGGQAVVGPGVVIGGGFGLQYTTVNQSFQNLPFTADVLAGGGVRPRFLLSVGYAF